MGALIANQNGRPPSRIPGMALGLPVTGCAPSPGIVQKGVLIRGGSENR